MTPRGTKERLRGSVPFAVEMRKLSRWNRGGDWSRRERERDGEQIREERETNVFNLKVGGKKRAL